MRVVSQQLCRQNHAPFHYFRGYYSDIIMSQDDLKRRVAQAAVNKILPILHPQAIIGVGTGSTANFFIDILAEYYDRFYGAVSSSDASAKRLQSKGIKVCSPSCCVLFPIFTTSMAYHVKFISVV